MKTSTEERLLSFLEGTMRAAERAALLDELDADPQLSIRLREAACGLDAMNAVAGPSRLAPAPATGRGSTLRRAVPRWWVPASMAATLALAIPGTLWLARDPGGADATPAASAPTTPFANGRPTSPAASYVLVLHGRWPDAEVVEEGEAQRRSREYWAWTSSLATDGVLVAAGDLRWEPGERLGPAGVPVRVATDELDRPDYVVGMFTLRVDSYEEALAIARECPHLSYGGAVSVRRVGGGFVTVPDMGDWSD